MRLGRNRWNNFSKLFIAYIPARRQAANLSSVCLNTVGVVLRTTPTLSRFPNHCLVIQTSVRSSCKSSQMADLVDTAVDVYRRLTRHPKVARGRISMEDTPGHLQVYSEWSLSDLERSESTKFGRGHIIQLDVVVPTPPHQLSGEVWNKESPSGR